MHTGSLTNTAQGLKDDYLNEYSTFSSFLECGYEAVRGFFKKGGRIKTFSERYPNHPIDEDAKETIARIDVVTHDINDNWNVFNQIDFTQRCNAVIDLVKGHRARFDHIDYPRRDTDAKLDERLCQKALELYVNYFAHELHGALHDYGLFDCMLILLIGGRLKLGVRTDVYGALHYLPYDKEGKRYFAFDPHNWGTCPAVDAEFLSFQEDAQMAFQKHGLPFAPFPFS